MPNAPKVATKALVRDVPADNPVGTMDRFTIGLTRVLAVAKAEIRTKPGRAKRKRQRH